jgi:hypothetical protein
LSTCWPPCFTTPTMTWLWFKINCKIPNQIFLSNFTFRAIGSKSNLIQMIKAQQVSYFLNNIFK